MKTATPAKLPAWFEPYTDLKFCGCGCGERVAKEGNRFIHGHTGGRSKGFIERPLMDRFIDKVLVMSDGCWEWTGSKTSFGHGQIGDGGACRRAYRVAYELFVGPIPAGRGLHHICQNPPCVNPTHLEVVTRKEHGARHRSTHCKWGHEFDEGNTHIKRNGARNCKRCALDRQAKRRARA